MSRRWQREVAEAAEGIADGSVVAGTVPTAMDASTLARTHTYTHKTGKGDRGIESKARREGHRGPGNQGWGGWGVGKTPGLFESTPEVEE